MTPVPWVYLGTTTGQGSVVPPPNPRRDADACVADGGTWQVDHCVYPNCPLILDVGHPGYQLTSPQDGVWFDIDADGVPDHVAWTEADSTAMFLAFDRNGNGRIDNGSELFGNSTPGYPDQSKPTAANGFEALKMLEGPYYGGGHLDSILDAQDAAFGRLLLWRDANHNGVSEPDELQSAAAAGLLSLAADYHHSGRHDRYGNEFRQQAFSWWDKNGVRTPVQYYDVWLKVIR
jgi:hypothetical protein